MDIAKWIANYMSLGKRAVQKDEGTASREHLDRKIDQTRQAAHDMVVQARREISHSERIIQVAEEAIRSLREPWEKHTK